MKPEEFFGFNAGKVWQALNKSKKPLTINQIMKSTKLKRDDVFGALGWLGREGKIEVLKRKYLAFKLL